MIGTPLKIKDAMSELSRRQIRIPEIQRAYVWRRTQIAKLLDSLYRGFPTGSILLWDTTRDVEMRETETNLGRNVKADFNPKIVLDGQQRLTSLGRVFDPETPRPERILFNVVDEVFEPHSNRQAADPRWIDVTEFLTEKATELDILERLEDAGVIAHGDRERRKEIHAHLKKLAMIREYQYPVEIVREDDLEIVTEVFIRVNSGGTRLRDAELALARLAWKLPGAIIGPIERLQDECAERGFTDIDSRFIMRALIALATRQTRFRDLKAFWARPAAELEAALKKTGAALKNALDFVEGNVGIPGSGLLQSHLSLIPLVVIYADRPDLSGDETRALGRWFLHANVFSHFVGSPETVLNQDLALLASPDGIQRLLDQTLHENRGRATIDPTDLERAGTASPFFPLAFLAVTRRGADDWFKGIKIRRDSFSEDQQIEYHHIFPKKLLNGRGVERYLRDEMANLAFLGQKANRRITASPPAQYLATIEPKRLEAQFVPMDRSLWELDRFDAFLTERRRLLAEAMNEVLRG